MAISGCGGGSKSVEVDGHVFHVPEKHLVEGTIPWLPASQSESLKFVINPDARQEEQMLVTIEATDKTCHPKTPPAYNQLSIACAAASKRNDLPQSADYAVERVNRDGDPTQWYYRLKGQDGEGQEIIVASCYAMSGDGKSGLCTALHNYGDLVYSVGLRSDDVERLPAIRKAVNDLLKSWEKH